jgi:hypothetical protein
MFNCGDKETYKFLVRKLCNSSYADMYDIVCFFADMICLDCEDKGVFSKYIDSEEREQLHQSLWKWFKSKPLDEIIDIQERTNVTDKEINELKKLISMRAFFIIYDLIYKNRKKVRKEPKKELKGKRKDIGKKGQDKEKEPTGALPEEREEEAIYSIFEVDSSKLDNIAWDESTCPEIFYELREMSEKERIDINQNTDQDLDISPNAIKEYLNSLIK